MRSKSQSFTEYARELFAEFGEIAVRPMFGGYGVYCDDLFFAIIADDELYLKVDFETEGQFFAEGLQQFVFEMRNGRTATMAYYKAPSAIFDDPAALAHWTRLALEAAKRAATLREAKQA